MRNFALIALVLGLVACRDSGGGDDTGTPDSNTTGSDVTIQEIQSDQMPPCEPANPAACVELKIKGVVVTAIDTFGGRTGDFWVQEPGGGPFSGVQVFGAPLDQVAALSIGDVVDISGAQKAEFALAADTSGNKLTELEPVEGGTMTVTKTGMNMPVQPQVVDALAIGQMTDFMARHAEWEKWEGVLITVNNVQAFSTQECITSMGMCNDMTYQRFDITGDVQVQSSLAAMPTDKVTFGDCFSGVTGVVGYFFDYQILPRTTAEIGTGGTSCPVENTMLTCEDGLDNDGNGYKDCADNGCVTASATCRATTTIEAIQTATTPPTGGIELQGVYVVAKQRVTGTQKPRNMWVSTNPTAAPSQGILVFGNTSTDLSAYAIGSRVNVIGTVKEFNDSMNMGTGTLTEISLVSHSAATGTGTIAAVTDQNAATLMTDATGELYESVLVTLTNVEIKAVGDSMYHVGQMEQGSTTFKYDDDIFRIAEGASGDPVGTCYSSITGIWSYQVYDNVWYFLPVAAGNKVGGICN
jgi:hypothetical protein